MARVTVCGREFERAAQASQPLAAGDLDVIVALTPPREPSPEPMRAASFVHERALPHIKHVGTFSQFHLARQARCRGFHDVLFVGFDGRFSPCTRSVEHTSELQSLFRISYLVFFLYLYSSFY